MIQLNLMSHAVKRFVFSGAAFQHLGYMAMRFGVPETLNPGATRAALTAVIRRMVEAPGTFDENGWLNAGVVGEQLGARDGYNCTGALYMCTMGLTHLGVPPDDPFWTQPAGKWFQQRVWSGDDIGGQRALKDKKGEGGKPGKPGR